MQFAATGALALALVLISPERLGRQSADTSLPTAVTLEVDTVLTTVGDRRQQIQFATENGTRIIWVLDPDLKL